MSEALTKIGITYRAIALLPSGAQVVLGECRDGAPIPVVATGTGDHTQVPAAHLTVIVRPRSVGSCPGCGSVWKVKGERTSHCTGCHETFEGGTLWDAHRIDLAEGKRGCKAASSMIFRGARLRKVADVVPGIVTVGTWRGPEMDKGRFAGGDAA